MKKVYLDCNILLDWLFDRKPYSFFAARIISKIEIGKIVGYASALSISNTHYLVRKALTKNVADEFLADARRLFKILDLNSRVVEMAIDQKFKDFEDDVHYFACKIHGIENLITRNEEDFRKGDEIRIMNAEQFLGTLES